MSGEGETVFLQELAHFLILLSSASHLAQQVGPDLLAQGALVDNDLLRLEGLLKALPSIPTKAGKARRVLAVMADAAYGVAWLIALVLSLGYRALLKPRGKAGQEHGSGLGKKRYVVERTLAWLDNDRRLRICYERTGASWQASQY